MKPFKGASRSRPDLPYIELPSFVGMVVRLWVLFFGATFIGIPILNDYVIAAFAPYLSCAARAVNNC